MTHKSLCCCCAGTRALNNKVSTVLRRAIYTTQRCLGEIFFLPDRPVFFLFAARDYSAARSISVGSFSTLLLGWVPRAAAAKRRASQASGEERPVLHQSIVCCCLVRDGLVLSFVIQKKEELPLENTLQEEEKKVECLDKDSDGVSRR